jgi:hypothetical protein
MQSMKTKVAKITAAIALMVVLGLASLSLSTPGEEGGFQ